MRATLINKSGPTGWPTFRFTGPPAEMARMLDVYDPDWPEWYGEALPKDAPGGELTIELDVYHEAYMDPGDAAAELIRAAQKKEPG